MKMTKANIAALRAGAKPQLYWDANRDHPGLGILVGTQGTKTWVLQGKVHGTGVSRRVSLGPVSTMTAEQAWDAAIPKRRDLDAGKDPRVKQHKPATVREALETYLKTKPKLRERSRDDYRSRVENQLAPWVNLPIASITAAMVQKRFLAIADEVAARRASGESKGGVDVRGGATANGAVAIFRALWNDQRARDPAMASLPDPTILVRRQLHEIVPRKRRVERDDLPAFRVAIGALPNRLWRDLVTLALFTGWREQEIAALRWSEVDLRGKMIHIPGERMKAHKPFVVPMSRQVADLLVARRALGNDGPFVFPGSGESGHTQSMTLALRRIAEACGVSVSPHDLRRTFVSIAQTCPIPAIAVKVLVAHSTTTDITERYTHLGEAEIRAAAQTVADRIDELCGITEMLQEVTRIG